MDEHATAALPSFTDSSAGTCAPSEGVAPPEASPLEDVPEERPQHSSQDWELLQVSQASLSPSTAGLELSASVPITSSVISVGGMGEGLLHSAHFAPLCNQDASLAPSSRAAHATETNQGLTPLSGAEFSHPRQPGSLPSSLRDTSTTPVEGRNAMVMPWPQEACSSPLRALGSAELPSGVAAPGSAAEVPRGGLAAGQQPPPSPSAVWSLPAAILETLPLEAAPPSSASQCSALGSSWVTHLPGDSLLSAMNFVAESQGFPPGMQQNWRPRAGSEGQVRLSGTLPLQEGRIPADGPLPALSTTVRRSAWATGGPTAAGQKDAAHPTLGALQPSESAVASPGTQTEQPYPEASQASGDRDSFEEALQQGSRDEEDLMDDVLSSFGSDQDSLSSDSSGAQARLATSASNGTSPTQQGRPGDGPQGARAMFREGSRPAGSPPAAPAASPRSANSRPPSAGVGPTGRLLGRIGWLRSGSEQPLGRRLWAALEEHEGTVLATALAAAIVGIMFLAQRWQLERRRNEQLRRLVSKKDEKIGQMRLQVVRLQEALSRQRHVPVLRMSSSFPSLSPFHHQL